MSSKSETKGPDEDQPEIVISYNRVEQSQLEEITNEKLERLYKRIDHILNENKRTETLAITLCVTLFATGIALFIAGYFLNDIVLTGSATAIETGILWPIRKIIKLREENIKLSIIPGYLDLLSPKEAAEHWKLWYEKWLNK